ncbi:MAG: hypothetical protein HN742_08810 [Lentisphaerae bacterium]|mgnify:CR=1 FL=1|jgi:hypothetical protein|nr:hypothetical protein [Lentisphaerota bacterium]MBT5611175.1 hypothetical protein [Lentisphaerota bacterium]MBT7054701.1 hypothetical protein [Lentisphaerota bacterium]MBT7841959.1 hypothetical protein [Lentisphaerota bacterium]
MMFHPARSSDSWIAGILLATVCLTGLDGVSRTVAGSRRMTPTFVLSNGETVVASAVVTAPPYNADSSGERDASPAIQKALDAVRAINGGVVFLPVGRYRLESGLRVGFGTTLQGEWREPESTDAFTQTVLLACTGSGSEDGPPLIEVTPGRETGVIGICIYYPEQSPAAVVPYPFAIAGGCTTLRKITLCNAYNGIDLQMVNASVVDGIRGTVLRRGVTALNSTEFAWMRDVRFSNDVWGRARAALSGAAIGPAQRSAVDRFTRRNLVGLELGRLDALAIDGVDVAHARLPVLIRKRPHVKQHQVFGYGGLMHSVARPRMEHGWDPWYYGMHYADLDNVPEAKGRTYRFRHVPVPTRVEPDAFVDVTALPYGAAGDGVVDDTRAISQALVDMGRAGGGTVYLPQGEYRVTAPLTVPSGVELRGPLGHGKIRQYRETCSLAGYSGRGAPDAATAPALLTLMPTSGVRGFNIVFPEQPPDVDNVISYPYAIRGAGRGIWIVDMHILNATYGIDLAAHRCDDHLVRDVWGTALYKGIHVSGGSRNGRLERVAWSYGPWAEAGRLAKSERSSERTRKLAAFHHEHSVHYTFGDCVGQKTWGLVGFYPRYHFHFVEENGRGCRDAEFWLSMHDVARETCLKLDAGGPIDMLGYFGTGSGDKTHNWFETSPAFHGPLHVYGKSIQPKFINHPITAARNAVRFFNECSLTTGRTVSASATAAGSDPRRAVDRDPRTWWEAPADALLDVDLGTETLLNRVSIEGAGRFLQLPLNTVTAELLVSSDGTNFRRATVLYARPGGKHQPVPHSWVDIPILPPVMARHVRLRVADPGADGVIRVAGFDVFGVAPALADGEE